MAKIDKSYHELLNVIMKKGYIYEDPNRKGVNRIEIPSYTFRHEFKDGFPAISTKKLHYKNVVTELIWFLRGDTNIKYLVDNGCNIWNKDAYNYYLKLCKQNKIIPVNNDDFLRFTKQGNIKHYFPNYKFGDLGPVYGHQWRNFNGVDQISKLIKDLKEKPLATDHIVNSWNVGDLPNMALPPCHYGFQVVVKPLPIHKRKELASITLGALPKLATGKDYENFLNNNNISRYGFEIHWQQRSVDTFLGLPYNIASYATLALILEKITGYKALGVQGDLKKVHLYDNSLDAVEEQLSRDVEKYGNCEFTVDTTNGTYNNFKLFKENGLQLNTLFNSLHINDFKLINYESYPYIKVEMLERDE